jgi:hypothetical protein
MSDPSEETLRKEGWPFSLTAASLLVVSMAVRVAGQDRTPAMPHPSTPDATVGEAAKAEGPDDVEAGVQLVEEGEFEKGIVALDAAVQRLTGPERHGRRARAYVYLGIAYFGLAQVEAARERFRAALGEVGDLKLSADEYPPRVVDLFEQARREVAAVGTRSDAPSLPAGTPVRVTSREAGQLRGAVVAMDEGWLSLGSEGGSPVRLPLASIDKIEQLVGRRSNTLRGVAVGVVAGIGLGLLMPVDSSDCSTTSDSFCSRGEALGAGVLTGALVGVVVGALTHHDVWAPVRVDLGRTSASPARHSGFRAALSLRF